MALAKMNKAVLVTGDGTKHFHAKGVGGETDSGLSWKMILAGLKRS